MNENEFRKEFLKMRGSRQNDIIYAVNCKVPKNEFDIKTECESMFFDRLMKQAEKHEEKYGDWPVFDMVEIESDDPRLDIYSEEV